MTDKHKYITDFLNKATEDPPKDSPFLDECMEILKRQNADKPECPQNARESILRRLDDGEAESHQNTPAQSENQS